MQRPFLAKQKTLSEVSKHKAVATQPNLQVSRCEEYAGRPYVKSLKGSVERSLTQLSQISDQEFINSLNNLKLIVSQKYTDLWARYRLEASLPFSTADKKARRQKRFKYSQDHNTMNTMNIEENSNEREKLQLNDSLSSQEDRQEYGKSHDGRNEKIAQSMQWHLKSTQDQAQTQVTNQSNSMSFADQTAYTNLEVQQISRAGISNVPGSQEDKNISFGKPREYNDSPVLSMHSKKTSQLSDTRSRSKQIPFSFTQYNHLLKDVKVESSQIILRNTNQNWNQSRSNLQSRGRALTSKELINLIGHQQKSQKQKEKEVHKLEQFREKLMRQISFGQNLGQEFGLGDINGLFQKKKLATSKDLLQSPQSSVSTLQSKTFTTFQNRKTSQTVQQPVEIYTNQKQKVLRQKMKPNHRNQQKNHSLGSRDKSSSKKDPKQRNRFRTKSRDLSKVFAQRSKQSESSNTLEINARSESQGSCSNSKKKMNRQHTSSKSKDSSSLGKPIFKDILEIATYLRNVRKQKVKELEQISQTEMRKQRKYTEVSRKQKSQSNQGQKKDIQLIHPSSLPHKNSDMFSSCIDQLSLGSQPMSYAQLERGSADNFYDDANKGSFHESSMEQMTFQQSMGPLITRQGSIPHVRTGEQFFNRRKKTSSKNRDKMLLQIQNRKTVSGVDNSKWATTSKPWISPKQATIQQFKAQEQDRPLTRPGHNVENPTDDFGASMAESMLINDRPSTTNKCPKKRRSRYPNQQNPTSGSEFSRQLASANSGREMLLLQNSDFASLKNGPAQVAGGNTAPNVPNSHTFYNNSSHNQTVNINIFVEPKKLQSPSLPSKVKQAVSNIRKSNPYYNEMCR